MPWHVETDNPDCAGFAVVKDVDSSIAGCHDTEADALEQVQALYANEPDGEQPGMEMMAAEQPAAFAADATEVPAYGVLLVEGAESGDTPRREFSPDSLTWADLPLPVKWQEAEGEGHDGSVVVGRMDHIWRDGNMIRWTGALDNVGAAGREVLRQRQANFVRSVSIRADDIEPTDVEYVYPSVDDDGEDDGDFGVDDGMFHLPGKHNQRDHAKKRGKGKKGTGWKGNPRYPVNRSFAADGEEQAPGDMPEGMDVGLMMAEPVKQIFHKGRIRSATVVAEPAFVEAVFGLGPSPVQPPTQAGANVRELATSAPAVVAAGWSVTIPEVWPEWWFDAPQENPPFGALHITPQGRVFGYLGPAKVPHRAFRGTGKTVTIPRGVDYSEFQNKPCLVAGGDGHVYRINAGNVTFDCGHANPYDPRRQDPNWAVQHYDNSCSIAARVRVGENEHGTWVAGGLLHGIDAGVLERMMGCALSGDWQGGKLKAALLVPVEGFPVAAAARVRVREDALVATAVPIVYDGPEPEPEELDVDGLFDLIASAIGYDDDSRWRRALADAGRVEEVK